MSRDPTAPERVKKYEDANRGRGLVRVVTWVPLAMRDHLLQIAARYRVEYREASRPPSGESRDDKSHLP